MPVAKPETDVQLLISQGGPFSFTENGFNLGR